MILDSSAIIAVLNREPGYERVLDHLASTSAARIGAPTKVETGIVLTARMGIPGRTLLTSFLHEAGVETLPFGDEHWSVAFSAFTRYGAGLNFGDCLTYATAAVAGEPLLCVGNDFARTDLRLLE